MSEPMVFDLTGALDRVDNDRELYSELLDIFFSDFDTAYANLKSVIGQQNLTEVRDQSHSLKSALGNLGAMRAYTLAQQIEIGARTGSIEQVRASFAHFESAVLSFKKEAFEKFPKS